MDQKVKTKIPGGLTALSVLTLFSSFVTVYYMITVPSYFIFGLFLLPLTFYMGIGILKKWPRVRVVLLIFCILMLLMSIGNLAIFILSEEAEVLMTPQGIIRNVIRLILFPIIIIYLNTKVVKDYFKSDKLHNPTT